MGGVIHVAVKGRAEDEEYVNWRDRETTEEELRSADALDSEAEQSTDFCPSNLWISKNISLCHPVIILQQTLINPNFVLL